MAQSITPVTPVGETNLAKLTARYGDYLNLEKAGIRRQPTGRHMRSESSRKENTLVDMVAVTESFLTSRLRMLDPDADPQSWEIQRKQWKKTCNLDFKDDLAFPEWRPFRGYVEARNAIQHGLGILTQQQLSSRDRTFARLDDAAIPRLGDRIVVEHRSVERCLDVCVAFVANVDRTAPGGSGGLILPVRHGQEEETDVTRG